MSRLAKTGGTLLGLAALGTFIAALGGPNVFSTFSNVLSTISPKTEIAVAGKEEKETKNKVSTESEAEEKRDLITEKQEEAREETPAPPSQPVQTITQVTHTEKQVQPQVTSAVNNIPSNRSMSSIPVPRGPEKPSGKKQYQAPNTSEGNGSSKGSGVWCGTSWGSFMMKESDTCLGSTFEQVKNALQIKNS